MKPFPLLCTIVAPLLVVSLGCGSDDPSNGDGDAATPATVGTACTPAEELPTFGGHSQDGTDISTGHPACADAACLANHVQGRVGCPYGQTEEDLALPADHPNRCLTPSGEPVTVVVQPQMRDRRADDNVYCSCRCDGPAEHAPFCTCPDDFVCHPLIEDLGLGSDLAGSYCVKEGTIHDPNAPEFVQCERALANCE